MIKELAPHDRPRERLELLGAGSLTDAELLAIILRTGIKGASAVEVAGQILRKFGGLDRLGQFSVSELASISGVGKAKAVQIHAALAMGQRLKVRNLIELPFDTPERIHRLVSERTRFEHVEVLLGLALDSKLRLIRCYEISRGLVNQTLIHARETYREAIAVSATHLVLSHNHPSGDPTPSPDDLKATRNLSQAGKVLGIPLLDHVIVGSVSERYPGGYVSLKELGILS